MFRKGLLRELSPKDPNPYPDSISIDIFTPCADDDDGEAVTIGRAKKPIGNLFRDQGRSRQDGRR